MNAPAPAPAPAPAKREAPPAAAMSPQDYAVLSALYDEVSELEASAQAARLQALRDAGHPLATRLASMLAAVHGPRTDELLPRWRRNDGATRCTAGQRVGPWRLLSPLGQGGMAEVWLARRDDGGLKREVALKLPFLVAGTAGAVRVQRFARERDILAALQHPHIAALLDAGIEPDGQAWLALERVDGQRITDWCDGRRADLAQRVALFRQALLAVQHAHSQLVIHRDIKPANVLVNAQGQVRLLDFGIAKLLGQEQATVDDTALTHQAGRPLTPRYASPEQLLGQPLSTASDVYSLGVLLHELLVGRLPYVLSGSGAAELERAVTEVEVQPPSRHAVADAVAAARATTPRALQRALAPELDAVLLRALAKRPADRYSSVDALLADIDRWCAGVPVRARVPSNWFRLRRFVARHRLGVGVGVAVAAGLVGLSVTALLFAVSAKQQSERAAGSRDFMLELFRKADVDDNRGAELSVREMLDWGRRRAAAMRAEPSTRADLLLDIALAQTEAADYAGAERSYAEVLPLLRRLGRLDDEVMAHIQRADLAVRMGQLKSAQDHLALAAAAWPKRPAPALVASRAQVEGIVALREGRMAEAVDRDARAAAAAALAWGAEDDRRIQIQLQQARSSAASGQPERALALIDSLLSQLAAAGYDDARQAANIEFERASVEQRMGRFGNMAARLAPATTRCDAQVGGASEICLRLRQIQALALLRRGDVAGARAMLPVLRADIDIRDNPRRRQFALVFTARVLASTGAVDETTTPWPELRAIAQAPADAGEAPDSRVLAQQVMAEAMLRLGRPAQAQHWLDAAQASAAGGELMAALAIRGLVLRGAVAWLSQRPAEALTLWQQATALGESSLGAEHPMVHFYRLNMVPAMRDLGRDAEAQALLRRSLPVLSQALGADAPILLRVAGWQRDPPAASPAAGVDLLL
jgi:serine/threonine-protein kinase